MNVYIKLLEGATSAHIPSRKSVEAAGYDLMARLNTTIILEPGKRVLIPCGFCLQLPEGYEAQVRPRSGLALKYGISVVNTPGTVDSDYRGEVGVILINHGQYDFEINDKDRIAQMVINKVETPTLTLVKELDDTERGSGGYGSTGTK